jgi:plasmid stabilization system protein ParE
MSEQIRLKLSAVEDLAEAYAWYETRRVGLGEELLTTIKASLESAARHPRSHAVAVQNVRRMLVPKFPYSIFYEEGDRGILVRAIFHNARKPSRWRRRLRENG